MNGQEPGFIAEWRRFDDLAPSRLYDLLRFRQAIFVVEQGSPYPDLDGLDDAAWHLLWRRGDELGGYLRLLPTQPLRIGRVCVAPARRGRGQGRQLVAQALAFAAQQWPRRDIALSAQCWLVPFYSSFGFAPAGAPYDDYGVAHLDMLRLAQ